jgi:hypothetical protein
MADVSFQLSLAKRTKKQLPNGEEDAQPPRRRRHSHQSDGALDDTETPGFRILDGGPPSRTCTRLKSNNVLGLHRGVICLYCVAVGRDLVRSPLAHLPSVEVACPVSERSCLHASTTGNFGSARTLSLVSENYIDLLTPFVKADRLRPSNKMETVIVRHIYIPNKVWCCTCIASRTTLFRTD